MGTSSATCVETTNEIFINLRLALCVFILYLFIYIMAQIFYTTVPVVGAVPQPVELDLNNLFQPPAPVNSDLQDNSIILDEEDVFQCGKCRYKFSFSDFVLHKKNNCQGLINNIIFTNPQHHLDEIKGAEGEHVVSQIALDNNNLITFMEGSATDSTNLSQSFPGELQNDIMETALNLDVKPYRLLNNLHNLEMDNLLQENYVLENTKGEIKEEVETKEEREMNCSNEKQSNDMEEFLHSETKEIKRDFNHNTKLVVQENFKLKCSFCGKSFRKNFDLQQHIRIHTGERPFLCVICGRAFTQKSNVIKHMETHKVWPKKVCNLPKIHVHVNSSQSSVSSFQMTGDKAYIEFDKSFVCQYCPSAFNSYTDWRAHMKSHVNVKVYKCIQNACDLTFSDLDSFLEHTQSHCGMASYNCHICQEDFHSLDDLGQHQYSHNSHSRKLVKNFLCRKCGDKFSNESALNDHKCNDYSCPLCSRPFTSVRFLRRHLALHNSEATYPCPDCDKVFKTQKYLASHRLIHSNEKPYNCQICSKAFNRRDKLVRHSLTHANTKKFKCPFVNSNGCTREFNRKDKLKQHMLTHSSKKSSFQTEGVMNDRAKTDELPRIEIVVVPIQVNKCQTDIVGCTSVALLSSDA